MCYSLVRCRPTEGPKQAANLFSFLGKAFKGFVFLFLVQLCLKIQQRSLKLAFELNLDGFGL